MSEHAHLSRNGSRAPVLVIGFGNILLGDEGVGVRALDELQRRYHLPQGVECIDGGASSIDLYDRLLGRDRILIADAIVADAPPGTLMVLQDDEIPAGFGRRLSPHQMTLSDTLGLLKATGGMPRHLTLVGLVIDAVSPGMGLGETAHRRLPALVDRLAEVLVDAGLPVMPRVCTDNDQG